MTHPRTILVPIDFSNCAVDVVRSAASLAGEDDAQLVLLHVIHAPEGVARDATIHPREIREDTGAEDYLREEANRLIPAYLEEATRLGISATYRIEYGVPGQTILSVAAELEPEQIVMGTHGRTGLARLVLGSVAAEVKRKAPCPVVTIKTQYKKHCKARSCAWCDTDMTAGERQLIAEASG